ncbi:putative GEM-like protein [Dioscorea sansibarensis]
MSVIGIPVNSVTSSAVEFRQSKSNGNINKIMNWMRKFSRKAENYTQGIIEHVNLGAKFSETVKGKLSLGARIIQAGGVKRIFRQVFHVQKDEKLLKASQCYLSTTAGPIAGLLFMSTQKIAFLSDRPLTFSSSGGMVRFPYKVMIEITKIKRVNPCEGTSNPNQKYIQIVTEDEYEFWFMGFICYQKIFEYLVKAIAKA